MCAVFLSAPHCIRAQQSYAVIAQNGVPMKTRDGVTLYSDIYRPKADGRFPVILMRTPYDKSVGWAVGPAYQIVTHGYVVSGTRFATSLTTATMQWNGLLGCHTLTAK
jgi:predicted acyl esterase